MEVAVNKPTRDKPLGNQRKEYKNMNVFDTVKRLKKLKLECHNRSQAQAARLRASLAQIQFNALLKSLPTSARKGYLRGKL